MIIDHSLSPKGKESPMVQEVSSIQVLMLCAKIQAFEWGSSSPMADNGGIGDDGASGPLKSAPFQRTMTKFEMLMVMLFRMNVDSGRVLLCDWN
jgi:hypothetical protein